MPKTGICKHCNTSILQTSRGWADVTGNTNCSFATKHEPK